MNSIELERKPVNEWVKENFATAQVFKKYGIDFCCHGNTALGIACEQNQVDITEVLHDIKALETSSQNATPFHSWPLDLLIDYILKIHHRGIRTKGPELLLLIGKVHTAHGSKHPELEELYTHFVESLKDLEAHLQKEENVLFPYFLELFEGSEKKRAVPSIHCGTIQHPIRVMHREHENEGERYFYLKKLTHNFAVPSDGCSSYRLMMNELERFIDNLFEHIHLENNILFPRFMELEEQWVHRQ